MKAFLKIDKLKSSVAPKITYLITFLDNNRKLVVYTGVNINELYRYLEMVVAPTTLTTSGLRSHHFGPSYYTNNGTETLQPVIVALFIRQNSIC